MLYDLEKSSTALELDLTTRNERDTASNELKSSADDRDSRLSRELQDSKRVWQPSFVALVLVGTVGWSGI